MRAIVLAFALLAPTAAFAACPGETLLSCPTGGKQLELCLNGDSLTYSFGPKGAPELTLTKKVRDVTYNPWPGVGSAIWDSVVFNNGEIAYEVWTSFERDPDNTLTEGGVNVLNGEELVATLTCAKGSVEKDLMRVWEAKEAAGQCWNFEKIVWQDAPCP
jgi:hypothetical protein